MKNSILKNFIKDTLYVIIGSFILALAINSILLPMSIVSGGISGLTIVLNHLFGFNPALVLYAINIPMLILCFIFLGKENGLKTVFGSLIFPFFVGTTAGIPVLTENALLAAVYGGIAVGIGLGLVFRGNASTGGTAIPAQILHKYLKVPLGLCISIVDGSIILAGLLAFDVDRILFSMICLFLTGRVIDLIQVGVVRSKNVFIVSPKYEEIKLTLLKELDKGVTMIPVKGGYHEQEGMLLMTVIKEKDFPKVKEELLRIDEHAFIISMNASEVFGRGFSLQRMFEYME
ncbi:YitT family protein [Enterococcus sp. BWT-B8]|uniref:YitT family protein n=1 Tax=Enterococcus sp. BWT-B8 TaxID=2885157 RepID=UPI001E5DB3F9|nr:YitT family protein [Enterococcus sp. BWT-B8]MCB5950656.1 YitT family protein [Enterococcus sp. BWT-B8]